MNNRDGAVPQSDEGKLENEIQAKGLTAPRITPALIDSKIVSEAFHVFPDSQLTVCCLTLVNGFTVTGESACASPENFNAQIGRDIAKRNARDKIWALEGYLLKQKLYEAKPQTRYRDAVTGEYVSEEFALLNPSTTVKEAD